jgi:hypothetical protein
MRRILVLSLFMLATLVWAAAQQPGTIRPGSGGQATSPNAPTAQVPDASQSQAPAPGSAGQQGAQSGAQAGEPGQMANAPITEGCLGGSNPNYTITDTAGKTYKLNIPAGADASSLASHIGEPVAVMGPVNKASSSNTGSIEVARIGRGTSKCPGSPSGAQAPPKQ